MTRPPIGDAKVTLGPRRRRRARRIGLAAAVAILAGATSAAADVTGTTTVGGTVAPTLSLSVGPAPSFGSFLPGFGQTYGASTTATITSTAGSATLTVLDPSATATGHLVNGSYSLLAPLGAAATDASSTGLSFLPVTGPTSPQTILTLTGPVASDAATIWFQQTIGANEALRTGTYSKSVTLTLSTTSP